jgi:uncharacterized damage-inducible protein DinB
MDILKKQYKLVKSAREAALNYYDTIEYVNLIKPVGSFNKGSIQYLILHIANTYLFWLKGFAFKREFVYFDETNVHSSADIRNAFNEVNTLVEEFLNKYPALNTPIEGEIFWLKKNMTYPVLQLFTHVTTHEFHHKGQVMTMSRILGYTPPDADIIRF